MRKLCTDEVAGVKMKKNAFCNLKKPYFLYCSLLAAPKRSHSNLCMLTKTKNKNQCIGKLNK